jgi:hypothetical protein
MNLKIAVALQGTFNLSSTIVLYGSNIDGFGGLGTVSDSWVSKYFLTVL